MSGSIWDMAFIEPMHRNKPNITYLLTWFDLKRKIIFHVGYLYVYLVLFDLYR